MGTILNEELPEKLPAEAHPGQSLVETKGTSGGIGQKGFGIHARSITQNWDQVVEGEDDCEESCAPQGKIHLVPGDVCQKCISSLGRCLLLLPRSRR